MLARRFVVIWFIALIAPAPSSSGDEGLPAEKEAFFERKIRPVLVEHCYSCHSEQADTVRGGLLLDTREGIRRGGDSGPAVTPRSPANSLILSAMKYDSFEMPPAAKLPSHVIADFEHWIQIGADDPRTASASTTEFSDRHEQKRNLWSLQPLAVTGIPHVRKETWGRNNIDRYILSKIESAQMQPAEDADRPSLLRRLSFSLIGLPPAPADILDFCNDPSELAEASEKVVDRLLRSEDFGRRWGRHWLDVVRYADSSGGGRSAIFPNAWRYRDYVIAAFNDDTPYDQFLREQIAGDLLPALDWQQRRRQLVATAFLLLGPTNFELQDKEVLEMDIVDEQLDTLGKAFLGLTLGCARCHDHKFDPVSAHDYYAMAGILKSTKSVIHDNVSTWNKRELPQSPTQALASILLKARIAGAQKELEVLHEALRRIEASTTKHGEVPREAADDTDHIAVLNKEINKLKKTIEELKASEPQKPMVMSVADGDNVGDIHLAIRGVAHNHGPLVRRGVIQACPLVKFARIPPGSSGRLQMAEWITHPDHPLAARVMANRVWYWLFGKGLVRTVDNFGATGDEPSHPELLDYLALRFIENGWSVKQLIKEIVLSRTYHQRATNPRSQHVDPDNRLLARTNRQRLDAECIRDALLVVGRRLDDSSGGTAIKPGTSTEYGYQFNTAKRSVYLPVFRNQLPQVFEVFDFADPNIQLGARANSVTVPQAHFLMNHPFVIEMANAAAAHLLSQTSRTFRDMAESAFLQVLGRSASENEMIAVQQFLSEDNSVERWGLLYQALLQTIDFRYLK